MFRLRSLLCEIKVGSLEHRYWATTGGDNECAPLQCPSRTASLGRFSLTSDSSKSVSLPLGLAVQDNSERRGKMAG